MTMIDLIAYVVPPVSALAGVCAAEIFNRWKRREHFLRVLFEKKLEVYSRLCGMNTNLIGQVIKAEPYEVIPESIERLSEELIFFMQGNYLLVSSPVKDLITQTRAWLRHSPDAFLKGYPGSGEAVEINSRLVETCRKELGLETFEQHVRKLS